MLAQFAANLGRQIHALAGGLPLEPLFAAPKLFGAAALEVLLEAELRRAERDGSAMELGLVDLRDDKPGALEEIGFDLALLPDRRHFAAAIDDADGIALVMGDASSAVVRRRVDAAIGAFTWRHPALGAGAAMFTGRIGAPLEIPELTRTAREALALATRARDGKTHRLEVAHS